MAVADLIGDEQNHLNDQPKDKAGLSPKILNRRIRLMCLQTITYDSDGVTLTGYLALPEMEGQVPPGVLVAREGWPSRDGGAVVHRYEPYSPLEPTNH